MLVVCASWPNIPCVDDLPFRVSVEDNVAVTTIELSICLGFHRNSAAAFHTPDLGNTEIIGKCWTSFWDILRSILLYHPLSSLSLCSQVLCYKARKDSSLKWIFLPYMHWMNSDHQQATAVYFSLSWCFSVTRSTQCYVELTFLMS